jgi:hypothetical protein
MSLAPLATSDDIVARLGRDLTPVEAIRVEPLLRDGSALIRRHCRRDFFWHPQGTLKLRGRDSVIKITQRPCSNVTSVIAIGGGFGLPDVPIVWFSFDGIDKIRIDPGHGIINLPEIWWTSDMYPQTFNVTLDYGFIDGVPDDVVAVCCNEVIGVLTAPTLAAGMIGETIGPYSYRMERGGGGQLVALSAAGIDALKDFRAENDTVMVDVR